MKKVVMILTVLLLSMTLFAGGTRVKSMGSVFSLIETTNYGVFPQRLLTGGELAAIGNGKGGWGLVRLKLNNFLDLPIPMAWQIKAVKDNFTNQETIEDLYTLVGLAGSYNPVSIPDYQAASQRINSIFAFELSKDLIAGLSLQMYSNSASADIENNGVETIYDHSFFGLQTVWGATMMLGGDDFVDFGILFDIWSWDISRTDAGDDQYAVGESQCDGIMKFGLNARYYNTGEKIDYAPYMKFDMFSFSATEGESQAPGDGDPDTAERTNTYDGSVMNFVLGSGVHYKPAKGVKVYNEFEFAYKSVSKLIEEDNNKEETVTNTMTLLPTYRCGVELIKEIDPKTWWGFNTAKLWGGFNKTFNNISGTFEDTDYLGSGNLYTDETTDATNAAAGNAVNITTGAALVNGNFMFEFTTTIDALDFDETALNAVAFDMVYKFK